MAVEFTAPGVLLALLPLLLSPALAQFPIPRKYEGFVYGPQPKESVVVLEAFFDLTCPGCRDSWPTVREVVKLYGARLRFVLHPFVLPFHHNSNFAARGLHTVASINESLAFGWLEAVFANQDAFSTEATWTTTPEGVVGKFADVAEKSLGIDAEVFKETFASRSADIATRISFKYGCLNSIVQTPSFFVNGVPVRDADDEWTVADWKRLLDPLVGPGGDANVLTTSARRVFVLTPKA